MELKKVRTRFAPSPTGYMHIGNLRTALFAYLVAKKEGGTFILRIEDTDQGRYVEGAVDLIYKTLAETGLKHDEGPDIGGPFGPYIQSERKEIYLKYAQELVEKGGAYYCFCRKEEEPQSAAQGKVHKYDGRCRKLTDAEIKAKLEAGEPYVIRQKIPEGTTSFDDCIYGPITVDNSDLDDGILIKSDGLPTYNFANVVDDHLMQITHVIRGSEYLSSTPKYNLLYDAFGWPKPVYIHCPPVMKNEKEKLSKRNGDASYEDLINKGYLKDSLINYIALLGWSPGGEQEKFSLSELISAFDVKGISKSPAIFDVQKLDWLNGEYIKEMDFDAFHQKALPYYEGRLKNIKVSLETISNMVKTRIGKFSDIPDLIDFFDHIEEYDTALFTHKKMKTNPENSLESLRQMLPVLQSLDDYSNDSIYNAMLNLIKEMDVKNGIVLWPLRTALSGKMATPCGGTEIAEVLGKEETIRRIQFGIELLEKQM